MVDDKVAKMNTALENQTNKFKQDGSKSLTDANDKASNLNNSVLNENFGLNGSFALGNIVNNNMSGTSNQVKPANTMLSLGIQPMQSFNTGLGKLNTMNNSSTKDGYEITGTDNLI